MLRLPEPAPRPPGAGIPGGAGWRFEPKLDGFRCLVCTHAGGFRARQRPRGWNITSLLPELAAALPRDVQLDGELVAYGADGGPDFHRLSARMLHGDTWIPVTYFAFDLLAFEGLALTSQSYSKRRAVLEGSSSIDRPRCRSSKPRRRARVVRRDREQGLEGVVAKRERDTYRPGEREWVKTKNRDTARFAEESTRGRGGASGLAGGDPPRE